MSTDPAAPTPPAPTESATVRRIHALKGILLFALTLLLGVVGGWFIHKLLDMEQVPWQAMVQILIILVVVMVMAALAARVVFKTVIARSMDAVQAGLSKAGDAIRQSPAVLTKPSFWLDEVWPTLRETKSVAFAWIGVYSTMAAVVALTALLCQTGSLAVSYLQINRLDNQNEKLERQTKLMEQQTSQSEAQNKLLETQNTLLVEQNTFSQASSRAALLQIVGGMFTEIESGSGTTQPVGKTDSANGRDIGLNHVKITESADTQPYRRSSPFLLSRIGSACRWFPGYRYLGNDGRQIESPRSPERGFVLQSLVSASIEITGLIDQRADFSYAELENAVMDHFRFEPTQVAASSAPGSRGLILAYAQMEGTSFRGSRLGEASFKGAYLDNAFFTGARLCKASFEHAAARGTRFVDADLRESWFTGADLTAADFSTSGVMGDTLLPVPEAFRMTDLSEVDLAGAFVAQENWLDVAERESRPANDGTPTFKKDEWKIVAADREPRTRHRQDEIQTEDLKRYRWRIANPDGSLQSNGTHGGTVITPRYDLHTPNPSPPKRK